MSLITDDKIKMTAGKKFAFIIMNVINTVHHSLICRKYAMRRIIIFLFAQICNRKIRKQIDKTSLCLCHQRSTISQEKDVFHPPLFKKNFAKSDNCTCLS